LARRLGRVLADPSENVDPLSLVFFGEVRDRHPEVE
jgi:hypothetical protein